jgi:hypothetical protein
MSFLLEDNDFIGMFDIAAKAMEIERLDNGIHLMLIESLLKNNKREIAMNYYGRVRSLFEKEDEQKFRDMLHQ